MRSRRSVKQYMLTEAKKAGPSGEDWEAMIAVGLEFLQNKDPKKTLPNEWERIEKYWDGDYKAQAEKLAKEFKRSGYSPMRQTGSGKGSSGVSPVWAELYKKHGGGGRMNKTPKTDVYGGNKRISLKKAGGSQGMSSKSQETFATFEAAMLLYGEQYPSAVNEILDSLKNDTMDFEKSGFKGYIKDIKKQIKDAEGDPEKMAKVEPYKENMEEIRKNGEALTLKVNKIFQDDPNFKNLFIFEASTGSVKFGDESVSRAERIVEFDPKKGKITQDWNVTTPKDVQSISGKFKFYFAFKSSNRKSSPYMSLRSGIKSEGVECPTFSTIIKEAFNQNEFGRTLLSEEYSELNEFQLLDKIKSKISNSVIGQKFAQMWEWIKGKIVSAFDWIKKQGNKALSFLLEFFGMKLSKVSLSGPIELFTESK